MKQFKIILMGLFLTMVLASCATQSASPDNEAVHNALKRPQVINVGPEFKKFWHEAQGKPFDQQLRLWNEILEKPHQSFFDAIVWQNPTNPKWEERKLRQLKKYFALYPRVYPQIAANFDHFNQTLDLQIARYRKTFPDAVFDLTIYAAPTATFNGKGGEGGDGADPAGKTTLVFGIDVLTERHDNPDVLYSHELFHIYHTSKIGVNEQVFLNQGKLTLPLWLEGLATYVSQVLNPSAPASQILMSEDLPRVSAADVRWLAKEFLKQANEKAFDEKSPEIYKRWFAVGVEPVRIGIPERTGYLLGLKVAEHLGKSNALAAMVSWDIERVHHEVTKALAELTQAPDQH